MSYTRGYIVRDIATGLEDFIKAPSFKHAQWIVGEGFEVVA